MTDSKAIQLRYARQISVPEIGREGQEKLCKAKVFIIGCGALGSMIAMQLAGAGIGLIGLADYDNIDLSNLQRQFFFNNEDIGKSKVEVLARRVKDLNPTVKVVTYKGIISQVKAEDFFPSYDFIIDATDNPESKRMTGEVSFKMKKPCCVGGIKDFSGQVMTFLPSDSRFEDYFGQASSEGFLPCSLGGVVGPAAALCASIQACEAIKYLCGIGSLISGKILIFNMLNNSFQTFTL